MGKNEKIKKEEKKKTIKDFFSSLLFLRLLFCFLILFIIGLGVLIYRKEKTEEKEIKPHITVPVYQAESDFEFGIDASLLAKEKNKEYIIKVTNYKDDKVNTEEISYQVLIENPADCVISVKKNGEKENLMKEQKSTLIEGEVLPSNEEKDIYYHIFIDSVGKLKSDDLLHVKIIS